MNNLKFNIVLRNSIASCNNSNICPIFARWYSENKDKKNDQDASITKSNTIEEKSDKVRSKLKGLLQDMIQNASKNETSNSIKLAQPIPKVVKKNKRQTEKTVEKTEDTVIQAVKEVAKTLPGDTKQTEIELMKKLLNNNEEDKSDPITNLSDIFKGMKIDRSQPKVEVQSRSYQVKQLLSQMQQKKHQRTPNEERMQPKRRIPKQSRDLVLENIQFFTGEPLGIFDNNPNNFIEMEKNATWDKLEKKELKLAVTHPPSNYFQQMIVWTQQEKLWKFPIDNEQGMEEEQNVYFADHVFLDKHLEPWCPPKGPIRHFMELVCVGLSKNPYLTVAAKREHIEWYKNYFMDKKQLLKEVGASLNEIENQKKIERV